MSVYTPVTADALSSFLAEYAVGEALGFTGITAGIENTNYFVRTAAGEFVLTLFEQTPGEALPFFLNLMAFLAEAGIPSAQPVASRDGSLVRVLNGRPAALVKRLPGEAVEDPDLAQCREIGVALAAMHLVTPTYPGTRDDDRGAAWRQDTARRVNPCLGARDHALLESEVEFQRSEPLRGLPRAVIHGDLFRDNALFVNAELSGIIDFYYAHNGAFIYDLAVTVSDWCYGPDGAFAAPTARAVIEGYRTRREVSGAEIAAWIPALRAAGLRFWLSRLRDFHFPRSGEITHVKNPASFKQVLLDCAQRREQLEQIWRQ